MNDTEKCCLFPWEMFMLAKRCLFILAAENVTIMKV